MARKTLKRPFAIYYYGTGLSWKRHLAVGTTTTIENARGRVAMHIAREDYFPKAMIVNRESEKVVCRMWRQTDGSIHRRDE